MRVLLVADGRSPTTRSWIRCLLGLGYEVYLVSSFHCEPLEGVAGQQVIPIAFSGLSSAAAQKAGSPGGPPVNHPAARSAVGQAFRRFRGLLLRGRYLLGPLSVRSSEGAFRHVVEDFIPDLVHALRIPYEGMLAASTPEGIPLAVSIWGNDLTLHARGSIWMGRMTRRCLARADALLADAERDLRLGLLWGFDSSRPVLAVPGSAGIDPQAILDSPLDLAQASMSDIPDGTPLVINPRGLRPGSVHTGAFFQSIPMILERHPEAVFVCPSLSGQPEAERWVSSLGIARSVRLLPALPQPVLWSLFKRARVFVSPSSHDGTPNSFLEASAAGCFPVVGDIESLREWIVPGVNGLLVQPDDSVSIADAVCLALETEALTASAARANRQMMVERASRQANAERIDRLYRALVTAHAAQ